MQGSVSDATPVESQMQPVPSPTLQITLALPYNTCTIKQFSCAAKKFDCHLQIDQFNPMSMASFIHVGPTVSSAILKYIMSRRKTKCQNEALALISLSGGNYQSLIAEKPREA